MKKIILSALFLLLCGSAFAMETPLMMNGIPSTSATNYAGFQTSFAATNDANARNIAPVAGTFEGLFVVAGTAPGGSASYAVTFEKNGADTVETCTITASATTCSDKSHFISISAGDTFSVKVVPSSTPSSSRLSISTLFNSGTGGPALFNLGTSSGNPSSSVANFGAISGVLSFDATGSNRRSAMPTAGTISKLYVLLASAPGSAASGKSLAFTIQKGAVNTSVTCTVTETATTCNDTSNSFSVAAGDLIDITTTPTSTPTVGRVTLGMAFTPTVDGESVSSYSAIGAFSNTADNYLELNAQNGSTNATEATWVRISPSSLLQAKTIYWVGGNSPGGVKTWTYGLRVNGATSALACTASGLSTTCTDTADAVNLAVNDVINFISSPGASSPTAGSTNKVAVVFFIDPNNKINDGTLYDSTIK